MNNVTNSHNNMYKTKQKFFRYDFVHVRDPSTFSPSRNHFQGNFDAIVSGSYLDFHGGDGMSEFQLYQLDPTTKRIHSTVSWYPEDALVLHSVQDLSMARYLVEAYECPDLHQGEE